MTRVNPLCLCQNGCEQKTIMILLEKMMKPFFYWQLRFCSGHKKLKIISYNEFHTFFELEINKNKHEMYPLDMDAHPCPSSPKTIFYNQHKIYFCPNPQMQFHMLTSIQLFIVWL